MVGFILSGCVSVKWGFIGKVTPPLRPAASAGVRQAHMRRSSHRSVARCVLGTETLWPNSQLYRPRHDWNQYSSRRNLISLAFQNAGYISESHISKVLRTARYLICELSHWRSASWISARDRRSSATLTGLPRNQLRVAFVSKRSVSFS